jgi:hypothetical protein
MTNNTYLSKEAKAWIKRKSGPDEIIQVVRDLENDGAGLSYQLYTAFDKDPDYLGRILFDAQGYWIYDGDILAIPEQEQVAKFIIGYTESI